MAALNRVMIIGNLGKDPESKEVGSGQVTSFPIAVTEKYKDRNGTHQETTEWVNVVCWSKLAEISQKYLKKGSSVYIEGKLKTRSWEDQNGVKKYVTEVLANSMQMLGGRGEQKANDSQSNNFDNLPPEELLPF